jgi:hypothetical protein
MLGKAHGQGSLLRYIAKLGYCLILDGLFWEFPHPRAFLHPNKIIGVCSQIFDSVICDWLVPPWSFESPQPKWTAMKPWVEKSEMVFLFQMMLQSFPTLCVEGGEFGPLLEVVWLHTHPLISGEFAFTKSPVENSDENLGTNHRQLIVYYNM